MKKLFVCAMALAAFVSCSKDEIEGPALDSQNKSIAITITNSGNATRGISKKGNTGDAVAEAGDMHILFANASKKILQVLPLVGEVGDEHVTGTTNVDTYTPGAPTTTDGKTTYVWHNVPAAVTNVAIIRDTEKDVIDDIVLGTTSMDDVKAFADDEATNIDRTLDQIFLYGEDEDGLEFSEEHVVVNGIEYDYYLGQVRVAPLFTRFEINSIQCSNLGEANKDGDPNTYGFDELYLKSLVWNTTTSATSYTIPLAEGATTLGTLWGSYVPTTIAAGADANTCPADGTRTNYLTTDMALPTATNTVWSWNIMPATFKDMKLVFGAAAYDYVLTDKEVELNVTGLAATEGATASDAASIKWEAENIYRVDLKFVEDNLGGKAGLCVKVEVEIATWTVNTVHPVFGTSGSSTAQ